MSFTGDTTTDINGIPEWDEPQADNHGDRGRLIPRPNPPKQEPRTVPFGPSAQPEIAAVAAITALLDRIGAACAIASFCAAIEAWRPNHWSALPQPQDGLKLARLKRKPAAAR